MNETPITWEVLHERECGEIPERATVMFELGNRSIDIRLREGELVITSSDTLLIKPRASNGIRITVE